MTDTLGPILARERFKKGDRVRFSPRAPFSWSYSRRNNRGEVLPASNKCVVVGFSTRDSECVRVRQDFRKSTLTIHHSFVELVPEP